MKCSSFGCVIVFDLDTVPGIEDCSKPLFGVGQFIVLLTEDVGAIALIDPS